MSNQTIKSIEVALNQKLSFSGSPGDALEHNWEFDEDAYHPTKIVNALKKFDAKAATAHQMRGFSGCDCDAVLRLDVNGVGALAFVGDEECAFLTIVIID